MADRAKRPPGEALVDLRRRLPLLSPRDPGRTEIIARASEAYGISVWTMYRALRELNRPKSVRRSDHGTTRIAPQTEMERYAEIVAALKIRTTNKKGRHVSMARAKYRDLIHPPLLSAQIKARLRPVAYRPGKAGAAGRLWAAKAWRKISGYSFFSWPLRPP